MNTQGGTGNFSTFGLPATSNSFNLDRSCCESLESNLANGSMEADHGEARGKSCATGSNQGYELSKSWQTIARGINNQVQIPVVIRIRGRRAEGAGKAIS